jgi:hypothetical protein
MGMSDDEFGRLTPRQLFLIVDQRREQTEHQELMFGIVASAIVNWSMRGPKKSVSPSDFMPSRAGRQKETEDRPPRINRKAIADKVRAFFDNNPNG